MKTKQFFITIAISCITFLFSISSVYGYYPISPYAYCMNNPVKYVDPTGCEVWVKQLEDGTYQVAGGTVNKDLNIYTVGADGNRTDKVIGQQLTQYSFFNEYNMSVNGAIINPNDHSGKNFLNNEIMNGNTDMMEYMIAALPNGSLDFKKRGVDNPSKNVSDDQHMFRGMPLDGVLGIQRGDGSVSVFGSARDVGNFAAGYVAGASGWKWNAARSAFDGLESMQQSFQNAWPTKVVEGMPTQAAQLSGFVIGNMLFPKKR